MKRVAVAVIAVIAWSVVGGGVAPAVPAARWKPVKRAALAVPVAGRRLNVACAPTPAKGGPCVRPDVYVIDLYAVDSP